MHGIKHISFDFWGTLARPNPDYTKARTEYLAKVFNLPEKDIKEIYTTVKKRLDFNAETLGVQGRVPDAYAELCKEVYGKEIPWDAKIVQELEYHTKKLFLQNQPIFPEGMADAIISLYKAGFSTSITSNTNFISGLTIRACREMEKMCFNFTLFSDLHKLSKPNRKFFGIITHIMELEPREILHVGDNELADIKGGESAGFKTAFVKNPDETLKVIQNILTYQNHA